MARSKLETWYMSEHLAEFETQEQITAEAKVLKLVINRLINMDGVVLDIGEVSADGETGK